jgi:hypothetical protein
MIRSPTFIPLSASASRGSITSHASGAPSSPWRGAFVRVLRRERIVPIGRTCGRTVSDSSSFEF